MKYKHLWIYLGFLPEGESDNSPKLLEAMEKKFESDFDAYKTKWVLPSVLYEGLTHGQITIKQANEYIEEKSIDLTLPEIAVIREDFINEQINILDKGSKEFMELPAKMRVVALQYLAFLETKRDPNNDYIIGIDKIKALWELNEKESYWEREPWEKWLERFDKRVKECSKLNCRDKAAFYTMVDKASKMGKVNNKLKDFAEPKFQYTHFNKDKYVFLKYSNPQIDAILG